MAGDFGKKVQSDNKHLSNLTTARFYHLDGSVTTPITVHSVACRLLRVTLNTNGSAIRVRNGSEVIANIASDAPETTFDYGLYCDASLIVEAGGAVDATIMFSQ